MSDAELGAGRGVVVRLAILVVAACVVLSGCDSSIESPVGGDSATGEESGPADDASDVSEDDATGVQTEGVVNACGGSGDLLWDGFPVELLSSCGAFDEGTIVCGGLDVLRCAGENVAVNICGGRGVLSAQVGTACGVCGDGRWVCAGDGDAVRCLGASAPNVCGGCEQLDGEPGAPCPLEEEDDGVWVCTGVNTQECMTGALNACGGQGTLVNGGVSALPGQPCLAACGGGVLACDGLEELTCVSDDSAEPGNACGGCGPLAGVPESPCGACEDGRWTCHEGGVFCGGGSTANPCGGCNELAGVVGERCDEGLVWGCNGTAVECFVRQGAAGLNACGGDGTLSGRPGEACGSCAAGVQVCETPDEVVCSVPNSAQVNACGGCGGPPGRLNDPCGTCGSGRLVCQGEVLACEGDLEEAAENTCGGCADLPGEPEEECGPCRIWTCNDRGGVRCVPTDALPGCTVLETCSSLACADQRRFCTESDGVTDAACGGCLGGYVEENGTCALAIGAPGGVVATQGTRTEDVLVTWQPVEHATGYHVFRNGMRVTEVPVTLTSWQDALAPAAGLPGAVPNFRVTTNRVDGVMLSWDPVVVETVSSVYTVAGVVGTEAGPESEAVEGYRGAPVLRFEVRIGEGGWQSIGNTDSWLDENSPLAGVVLGTPLASGDRDDGILVTIEEPQVVEASERSYRIRAVNSVGEGETSASQSGRRVAGALALQWEWAFASAGNFTALSGATSPNHLDVSVAPASRRWYRLRVDAPGIAQTFSALAEGERKRRLGAPCSTDVECQAAAWCATDTSERRCSPRPVISGVSMPFQWVPRGQFTMGSPVGERGRVASHEGPVSVTLTRDYFVQRTPVTQGQWEAVTEAWNALPDDDRVMPGWAGPTPVFRTIPSCFRWPGVTNCTTSGIVRDAPVERVNAWEAMVFANTLSILEGLEPCYTFSSCSQWSGSGGTSALGGGCNQTNSSCDEFTFNCNGVVFEGPSCEGYRLLTEAEWERAVRAGTTGATYLGNLTGVVDTCDDPPAQPNLDPIAWWCGNLYRQTTAVGSKAPNAWGLYDMLGHVLEWTWSTFDAAHTGGEDPLGASIGWQRVLRGGGWVANAGSTRSASRSRTTSNTRSWTIGFRLGRSLQPEEE